MMEAKMAGLALRVSAFLSPLNGASSSPSAIDGHATRCLIDTLGCSLSARKRADLMVCQGNGRRRISMRERRAPWEAGCARL